MSKADALVLEGTVVALFKGDFATVQLPSHTVLCRRAGKLVKNKIKLMLGDKVTIEVSPYDLARGRIVFRHR